MFLLRREWGNLLYPDPDTHVYYQMFCCCTVKYFGYLGLAVNTFGMYAFIFFIERYDVKTSQSWIPTSTGRIQTISVPFFPETLTTVAVANWLLLISAMLLPVGGPRNEWWGVGGSTLNGMPEIFSYTPRGPFSFSRPELIIVWLKLLFS